MTETTVAPRTNLTRATAGMSAVTLVSRLTGFVRVWVVLNVLGSTLLNDVYQSANYVPNILYALLAAGAAGLTAYGVALWRIDPVVIRRILGFVGLRRPKAQP